MLACFACHMWQAARQAEDVEMESWAAMLLLFVERTCCENGTTQLAWLLMGLPDPNRNVLGLRPFSKLCPSLWVLANVAYLREMDWIARRRSASQPNPPKNIEPAGDDPGDPKKKPLSPLKWTTNEAYSGFM